MKMINTFQSIQLIDPIDIKIKINAEVHSKMELYIRLCTEEISWLGTVEKETDKNSIVYTITDVLLPKQEVSMANTNMDEKNLNDIATELLKEPDGVEKLNSIRFWGHSHVNMNVGPSTIDERQMDLFRKPGVDYFIRGIGNKKGELSFDLFDYNKGLVFKNVDWEIATELSDMAIAISEEIKQKVSKIVYQYKNYNGKYSKYNNLYQCYGVDEFDDFNSTTTFDPDSDKCYFTLTQRIDDVEGSFYKKTIEVAKFLDDDTIYLIAECTDTDDIRGCVAECVDLDKRISDKVCEDLLDLCIALIQDAESEIEKGVVKL